MKLLIKQRVFSWSDTYDIYDEQETPRYFVKAEIFSLGHQIHVFDARGREAAVIRQRFLTLLPAFDIEVGGRVIGSIEKEFALLCPKYQVNYNGWQVEGDILGWEYNVLLDGRFVAHISKEPFHWGDTYIVDITNPEDELQAILLVIAIDAANCTDG
jgi:uncharacterized protein YxjI